MLPPFTDAGPAEVSARVLYRYVELRFQRSPSTLRTWRACYMSIRDDIYALSAPAGVGTALLSAHLAIQNGTTLRHWLDTVIGASRTGHGWRRCFYSNYKASRDPRVTNRGVRG